MCPVYTVAILNGLLNTCGGNIIVDYEQWPFSRPQCGTFLYGTKVVRRYCTKLRT